MNTHSLRPIIGVLAIAWSSSALAAWSHLGELTSFEHDGAVVVLHCGESSCRLEAINDSVVRVRMAPEGRFDREFSWAVLDSTPRGVFEVSEESPESLRLDCGGIRVTVQRNPCRVSFCDRTGHSLLAEAKSYGMGFSEGPTCQGACRPVRFWFEYPDGTGIFGLGEKAGSLHKGDQAWSMWNRDAYAYNHNTDPLYMSVPFFMSVKNGVYHGVFLDNSWRTSFDFGKAERNIASFGAEGGELDFYVIAGPNPKDVIERYTELVGRIELPPRWAIGYHQCRYSYFPDSRVREVASEFRKRRIPCDVLWFDIDYMDGYRCFTWDSGYFPNPKQMTSDLKSMGFHTIAIVDPGIKADSEYHVFQSGCEHNVWLHRPDGETYVGRVWPGEVSFPDFTNPKVRDWWAGLFPAFLDDCGLDGIWNDMNEPADFAGPNGTVPLELLHDNEGQPASHRACHNIYGMQMVRATREGLLRARPEERPFALTRASYAGGQRYGAAWTGDNVSSWEHMKMSIPMALNMGISGMPFVGPDIGGFVVDATGELFARWMQVGALFPFCRAHTGSGNPDQEPWSFGPEIEEVVRKALERRYAWLPYIYTLFEEASRTGLPVIRPIWMEGFHGPWWFENQTFMLGSDILVIPNMRPGKRDWTVELPKGVWYDGNSGMILGGGQATRISADIDTLPYFIRAGAIIPMQSPVQSTTHAPSEPLMLDVWPYGTSSGTVYEDDGTSYDYREGVYRRTVFTCETANDHLSIVMHKPEGTYEPKPRVPLVRLHGVHGKINRVLCAAYTQQPSIVESSTPCSTDIPNSPGEFVFNASQNAWLIRMQPDSGVLQELRVEFSNTTTDAPTICFDFEDVVNSLSGHPALSKPTCVDGAAVMVVRESWSPLIALPRTEIPASELPILKMRISTQHTNKLGIRFANEEKPDIVGGENITIDLIPDGEFHEYTIDLGKLDDHWSGTVYWVEFPFIEGSRAGEQIRIDRIAFERQ